MRSWESARPREVLGPAADSQDRMDRSAIVAMGV